MQSPAMNGPEGLLVESYWVLPGRFLAGEYPAHTVDLEATQRLDQLLSMGINSFFDLTQPGELPPYLPLLEKRAALLGKQIEYQRFPILDYGLPQPAETVRTLDAIDLALANDHKIFMHCWGGVGRTGLTVGCFLVRHGRTGSEALQQIAEWWQAMPKRDWYPRSPETQEQVEYILNWNEQSQAAPD